MKKMRNQLTYSTADYLWQRSERAFYILKSRLLESRFYQFCGRVDSRLVDFYKTTPLGNNNNISIPDRYFELQIVPLDREVTSLSVVKLWLWLSIAVCG